MRFQPDHCVRMGLCRRVLAILLAATLFLSACAPFTATPTPQPRSSAEETIPAVRVSLRESSSASSAGKTDAGTHADVVAHFEPWLVTEVSQEGYASSYRQWTDPDVAEMQVCIALDTPCQPPDAWAPFAAEQDAKFLVDWLGPRPVWVVARFRDSHGQVVKAFGEYALADPVQVSVDIVGVRNTATPVSEQLPPIQTAVAATEAVAPVEGSVEIEGGKCCAGGRAGDSISLQVAFQAQSPYGPVTEMRVQEGFFCTPEEMAAVAWEPFVAQKEYTTTLVINWVGWYIAVQYRDDQGHVSPVYCDDISLEGSP